MSVMRFGLLAALGSTAGILVNLHRYHFALQISLLVVAICADAICDAIKKGGRA